MNSVVYILESPGPQDFLENTQEGDIISKTLTLAGVPSDHFTVVDRACLKKAVEYIRDYVTKDPHTPIIHVSSHGNEQGIALTSEVTLVSWAELRDLLAPLSEQAGDRLLLCFSTCFGRNAYQMAASFKTVFEDAVGPVDDVEWTEAVVAYSTFYHLLLQKGFLVKDAVAQMNASIGARAERFQYISGTAMRNAYKRGFIDTFKQRLLRQDASVDA